jgi:hypothetical protein
MSLSTAAANAGRPISTAAEIRDDVTMGEGWSGCTPGFSAANADAVKGAQKNNASKRPFENAAKDAIRRKNIRIDPTACVSNDAS